MKKIIFFVEPDWAFGSVHYELFKYLWTEGYNCNLLPWNRSYTELELTELNNHVDLWVTTHHGYRFLTGVYKVEPEKCVVIAHAVLDINELIHYNGIEEFYKMRKFGVVSSFLKDHSLKVGITREPDICPIAINYNTYYNTPSKELKVVGFAGSYHEKTEFSDDMISHELAQPKFKKRGYLVKEAAEKAGLEIKIANLYHNSFVTMGGFYKSVDCVIMASTEEGAGLPVLEAGAAGKLVIGTPVGHWNTLVGTMGGIEVPIPDNEFLEKTVEILNFYKNNPDEYYNRCLQIQQHAKSYDWSNVIQAWVNILQ